MNLCVNSIIIYNKQDMETNTQHWMNVQRRCGTYLYNGLLFNHNKEWNLAICNNMDGPREYHSKWSKSNKDK